MIKKILLVLAVLLLLLVGMSFFASKKAYPAASVNGDFILAKELSLSQGAARLYYEAAIKTYPSPEYDFDSAEFANEIKRSSLDALVESVLINQELVNRMGEEPLAELVEERLSKAESGQNLAKAIRQIYGMETEDFYELVLRPGAERDILREELAKENISLGAWLADARLGADVSVFAAGLKWEDGQVRLK